MKILVLLSVFILTFLDQAQSQELIHFHAGKYKLKGDKKLCGQSTDFKIFNETQYLFMGERHGFSIKDTDLIIEPSEIKGEEGCKYYGTNEVKVYQNRTELILNSEFKCGEKSRYALEKHAIVTNKIITMTFIQTGENSAQYSCEWARQ